MGDIIFQKMKKQFANKQFPRDGRHHQRKYAGEILKRFDMEHCNHATTPSEPRLQLSKNGEEAEIDPTQYRRLIGSLRYLCNTRPDLAYSVGVVSRFMQKPKLSHLAATKRILRYIRGTQDYGIFLIER
jgi:hypothetical protein